MAMNADIFDEREQWRAPLVVSAVLHGALFVSLIGYAYIVGSGQGSSWGNGGIGGDAMNATLVTSIPLPAKPNATNVLATENKGLSQSQPKPKVEEPEAIPIPDKKTKIKPSTKPVTPTQEKPREVAEVDNKIPFGEGGPVSGPYGVFNANGAKGGFSMTGGTGDFGSRYGWYVDAVRRKVSDNWLRYQVDPSVSNAQRVYITFEINRSGAPGNIKVEQSSGIPSLDISAMRALQRIDTFGPLPNDYSGSRVSVEFWFDYKR
jgi:protein TonB